jgi:hypothetical protein
MARIPGAGFVGTSWSTGGAGNSTALTESEDASPGALFGKLLGLAPNLMTLGLTVVGHAYSVSLLPRS